MVYPSAFLIADSTCLYISARSQGSIHFQSHALNNSFNASNSSGAAAIIRWSFGVMVASLVVVSGGAVRVSFHRLAPPACPLTTLPAPTSPRSGVYFAGATRLHSSGNHPNYPGSDPRLACCVRNCGQFQTCRGLVLFLHGAPPGSPCFATVGVSRWNDRRLSDAHCWACIRF